MATFSDLYSSQLTRELGVDDSTVLFTTARRKDAINAGMHEFADLTECLTRQSTITVSGGTGEYDLNDSAVLGSTDFVRLSRQGVEFHYTDASSYTTIIAGDDLVRRDVEWLNRYEPNWKQSTVASSVRATPTVYYLRADGPALFLGFTLSVPSTGSSASAKAIVPYVAKPAELTSDTQEPFAVNSSYRLDLKPYHRALVHFAASELEKLRRDDQASDRQLQKFLSYVQRYLSDRRPKGGQSLTYGKSYWRRRESVTDPRTGYDV